MPSNLLNRPIIMVQLQQLRILIAALLAIPLFLWMDSPAGDVTFGNGQLTANIAVFTIFMVGVLHCNSRTRTAMLIGILVGFLGECLFSLVLNMYHYRFDNIPLWVAFGHGMIFGLVYRASKKPLILRNTQKLKIILLIGIILFSTFWFFAENDVFGFICTLVFLAFLIVAKKSQLFFLLMFYVVLYIELVGTYTGTWWWPNNLSSIASLPSSGNPPTGIAVFYFLFDFAVFYIYLHAINRVTLKRYRRFEQRLKANP